MLGGTRGRHTQLGAGRLQASIERFQFCTTAVRTTTFSAVLHAVIETPPDTITLGFALRAPDPFVITGERLPVGTLTVFGAGGVIDVRYPVGATAITLALPTSLYERESEAISQLESLRVPRRHSVIDAPERPLARLRDVIASVQQLAVDQPHLFDDGQWRANAERALLDAFFGMLVEAPSIPAPPDKLRSARRIVLETEALLNDGRTSIPAVSSLCSALRISRRTMERAFQDMMGMSPARYLRVRALNAVREQLIQCHPVPGTITRVAIEHGFWHLGRFSTSYRRLFGERPIETFRQSWRQ